MIFNNYHLYVLLYIILVTLDHPFISNDCEKLKVPMPVRRSSRIIKKPDYVVG